ncbi:hypothetical protein, partial [Cellulomonas oligotrophica]|uniref:hypothetical protein n=1 Tax=Cellulomonas oligotrophica TaxID=931536 RepID=UPI0031ECD58D
RSAFTQPSLLDQLRLLLPLLPPRGYFPDFLTPTNGSQGLRAGIEAILSTPKQRLRAELELLDNRYQLPSWVSALAEGDREVLRRLTSAIVTYHEVALAPYQSRLQACVDSDRAVRARTVLDAGAEGLLSGLRPMMRWSYPILEVEYPVDQELRLDGRGLLLLPSFFCYQYPVSLMDPTLTPVLVYPVERDARWIGAEDIVGGTNKSFLTGGGKIGFGQRVHDRGGIGGGGRPQGQAVSSSRSACARASSVT